MTYIPRLEPYDYERPEIVLKILDELEQSYLASLHEHLDASIQDERLAAWHADAEAAAARIDVDWHTEAIRRSYRRAQRHRDVRG